MAEHYNSQTVEASAWCSKCWKNTPHMVGGHKLGSCITCIKRLEEEQKARQTAEKPDDRQQSLFP
jgi:predicted amidophosphoribosyltransferase